MKISEKLKQEMRRELASAGGKARAKKYDKQTLSKWAKKGGRPRKEGAR
jgi:general stress protein YciG